MTSLELDVLWTVAEAAEHARVSEATIRSWVHRDHLPVARNHEGGEIRDHLGRPRFWPVDVAKAEMKTRKLARRQPPRRLAA